MEKCLTIQVPIEEDNLIEITAWRLHQEFKETWTKKNQLFL